MWNIWSLISEVSFNGRWHLSASFLYLRMVIIIREVGWRASISWVRGAMRNVDINRGTDRVRIILTSGSLQRNGSTNYLCLILYQQSLWTPSEILTDLMATVPDLQYEKHWMVTSKNCSKLCYFWTTNGLQS